MAKSKRSRAKPKPMGRSAVLWVNDQQVCTCPQCGHSDDLDGFDVMGADAYCVFCNNCSAEFDVNTSAIVVKDATWEANE